MKSFPTLLRASAGWGRGLLVAGFLGIGWADAAVTSDAAVDPRAVLASMVTESDHDFQGRVGEKASESGDLTFYQAKEFADMLPGKQFIMKSKGLTYLMVDFSTPEAMAASKAFFFAMPQFSDPRGAYTTEPDPKMSNADKIVTSLIQGGHRIANFMEFRNGKDTVLCVGPIGGRATSAAPTAPEANASVAGTKEQKLQSFANGIQFLVQRAGGNFQGLIGPKFRTTADGDPLYGTIMVADLQAGADASAILGAQNRYFFMTSYDAPADVAFALEAFQALPHLITHDRYEVELDHRLEKASSSTYHLRYNGQIVGDFIYHKDGNKALLNLGYRDGIPANLMMGTGRTYSDRAVAGAKEMIVQNTLCENCHGVGTEEIESKYVYKGTGLPKMIKVPCHFCHGTGHL